MKIVGYIVLTFFLWNACTPKERRRKCLEVTATAYNSIPSQTRPGTTGRITAWGDTLTDSIPSIAISRDLLDSGLTHGTRVKIEGFKEKFVVNDKMNRRYTNRIDVHFGRDVKAALEFGVKKVRICWKVAQKEEDSE